MNKETEIRIVSIGIYKCQFINVHVLKRGGTVEALPGVLGIQGEGLFIFRDLGRRVIYFQGFGEKTTFWGFREQGAEEKHFRELGRKVIFLSGSREQRPPWGRPHGCSCMTKWARGDVRGLFCPTLAAIMFWCQVSLGTHSH